MAHFAQIDSDNIVTAVIVVNNEDCLDSKGNESEEVGIAFCQNLLGTDTNWVQASYNSNFRFRYPHIGMKYDSTNYVFYNPVPPYPSWVLNTSTWDWDAPVEEPHYFSAGDGEYTTHTWDESTLGWIMTTTKLHADDFRPETEA